MQQKRRSSAAAADTASRDGVALLTPALLLRRCYRWRVLVPRRSRGLLRKADGVVVPAGALTCAVQRSARSWEVGVASEMPVAEPGQGSGARSVLLFASRTRDAALVTDRRWDDVGYGCRVGWLSAVLRVGSSIRARSRWRRTGPTPDRGHGHERPEPSDVSVGQRDGRRALPSQVRVLQADRGQGVARGSRAQGARGTARVRPAQCCRCQSEPRVLGNPDRWQWGAAVP